jgi:glycosyltransferase involved in cell wall biosynthesis
MVQPVSGNSNGVKSQAVTWASGLKSLGHEVQMIGSWEHYDWQSFDVIHLFGIGTWLEIVPAIAARTDSKIVLSPIIDTDRNYFLNKCASYCGIEFLHMTSPLHSLRRVRKHISMYYVRSDYEKKYLTHSFDINSSIIEKIPLSCRFKTATPVEREGFCLHVSILSSKNKNVKRLIEAGIKYKFKLVLAGNPGTEQFRRELMEVVNKHDNIEYLGFLSEPKLIELYSTAKVFALPSIFEGVGLVALEAAALGSDVVLTNRGAPKEYYDGMAFLVDPLDVDEIGSTITNVIAGQTHQPELSNYVIDNYNNEHLIKLLECSYLELTRRK